MLLRSERLKTKVVFSIRNGLLNTILSKFALKNFAAKFLTLFGSTYICEQAFSCLNINKSKNRSLLTDTNLRDVMRISTSKLAPNLQKIVKNCEQLHKSH